VARDLGLDVVPVVESNATFPDSIDEVLKMAEGVSQLNPNVAKEGDVWVSGEGDERISFKVISNSFLLDE
jgi:hypothetical protein